MADLPKPSSSDKEVYDRHVQRLKEDYFSGK